MVIALCGLLACGDEEAERTAADVELEAIEPIERDDDVDPWCEDMLDLREIELEEGEGVGDVGPLLDSIERGAPEAVSPDIALVVQGARAFAEGESLSAAEEGAMEDAFERVEAFLAETCTDTLQARADREGEPCPEPLESTSAAIRLHEVCEEIEGVAFGLQSLVVPAITGDNELPPDGGGPNWNSIDLFCRNESPVGAQRIAAGNPDDEAGRLAAEMALALEEFLTGCQEAVANEDVELFRSLNDSLERLGELSTEIITANHGDLDGPD